MVESNRHQTYKEKLRYALVKHGWTQVTNEALRKVDTMGLHIRDYLPYGLDVYGEKGMVKLGIEVDNPEAGGGHRSPRERAKDKARTNALWEQFGILVIRFEFYTLKGLGGYDSFADQIIQDINHEVWRKYPTFPG